MIRHLSLVFLGLSLVCTGGATEPPPSAQVVVLYFHRTARCPTCLNLEAYTAEAVGHFPADRESERLQWRAVNLDEESNRHFAPDYALEFSSVLLSRRVGGKEVAWTNLPAVWAIVGDKSNFIAYVEMEIAKQLEQLPKD
jgi:hypothetical protein